jgi:hypothetical protein
MNKNYVVYLDTIGRMLIGVNVAETEETIDIQNPLIIHPETDGQGKLSIQFFPIMLREFQASRNEPTVWTYNKKNITLSKNMMLDLRLIAQYERIFEPIQNVMPIQQQGMQPIQPSQPTPQNTAGVIKLFDD